MALITTGTTSGGGGGSGTVTNVSSGDTSIVVTNPTTTPALQIATLDVIATNRPPAAAWSNNSKKITSLANGAAAQDAAAFGQIPTALPPNGAAGGSLAGNYPNPTIAALAITNAEIAAAAAIGIAKLADPTTGKVIGSAAGAAAAVFPPGFELDYVQITATVNVVSTTEATGTTIITSSAIAFDGTAVLMDFYSPLVSSPSAAAGNVTIVCLFEGATEIARIGQIRSTAATVNASPMRLTHRFTPSAATHTYTVTAFASNTTGTPAVQAGAGGTGLAAPAFIRFTKV